MSDIEERVYSKEVIEFTAVASEYCRLCVENTEVEGVRFLAVQQKLLPLLYYKTLLIKEFDPVLSEPVETFVTEEEWTGIEQAILKMLGEANDYLDVPDSEDTYEESVVAGSIAENMADIFQDLKDFLVAYNIGTMEIMNDALWQCLENFRLSWGRKVVVTIKAIHDAMKMTGRIGIKEDDGNNKQEDVDTSNWIITKRMRDMQEDEDE